MGGLFGDEGIIGAFFADDTTAKPVVAAIVPAANSGTPSTPAVLQPVGTGNSVALPSPATPLNAALPALGNDTEGADNRTVTTKSPLRDVTEIAEIATVMEDVQTNEVAPVEVEALETAASENVVVETPSVVESVAAEVPVVTEASQPAKETSEEEDLIEGIVNTLIEEDADGMKNFEIYKFFVKKY